MMEAEKTEFVSETQTKPGVWGFAALAVCLACAVWRTLSYDLSSSYLPGIGLTVALSAMLLLALVIARKNGFFHPTPFGIVCLICTEGLAVTYALYGSFQMRGINLITVVAFYVYTLYILTVPDGSAISFRGLVNAAVRAFTNCFRSLPVPFRALRAFRKEKQHGHVNPEAVIGIILALFIVPVVLLLLGSADEMFSNALKKTFDGLGDFDFTTLLRILFFAVPCGLILFSQVFSPSLREEGPVENGAANVSPAVFTASLIGLTAAFALFAFIQVKYLFLGREAAVMAGGFADYARSGFFQLVGVAFIALLVVQPALALSGDKTVTRALCLTVSLLTEVIVASAFLRMRLYVLEYGLTILRVLVLWAIFVLCGCFIVTAVKSVKPSVLIFPFIALLVMVSWTLLCLTNPAKRIADYNVSACESGQLEHLDTGYLYELLPASGDALTRCADSGIAEVRSVPDYTDVSSFQWAFEFK